MVDADLSSDAEWVFINWHHPGQNKFTAVKDVKRIEQKIRGANLKGWYAESARSHTTMHKILTKMDARKFREDAESLYFIKEVI